MFKFFDKANSGPHAYFLKRFASISPGFPAQKRPLLYHGSGGRHHLLISEAGSQSCVKGSSPQLTCRQQFSFQCKEEEVASGTQAQKDVCNQILCISTGMQVQQHSSTGEDAQTHRGQHVWSEPWEAFVLCTKRSETGRQPQEAPQSHLCSRLTDKFLEEKEQRVHLEL